MASKKPSEGGKKPSDQAKKPAKQKGAAKPSSPSAEGAKKKAVPSKKKKPAGPSGQPKGKSSAKTAAPKAAGKAPKKPAKPKPTPKKATTVKPTPPKAAKPVVVIGPGPGGPQTPDSMLPELAAPAPVEPMLLEVAPAALPPGTGGAAVTAIQIGGGSKIHSDSKNNLDGFFGTVTIACRDGLGSKRSMLTAGHVVGLSSNSSVKLPDRKTIIGGVVRIGAGGQPIDAAVIKVKDGVALHRDVVTVSGATFKIGSFAAPVVEGVTRVIHGGPHGKNGTITGLVEVVDAGVTTIGFNNLNGEAGYKAFGLMKIRPLNAPQFGVPGDSGAPVLTAGKNADGEHDLVGLLVAVDNQGFGYAHPMDGPDGIASQMIVTET